MNRRLVFMKARLEKDMIELEEETSQNQHLIQRRLLGVEIGNQCAFINFQLCISCGPFDGSRLSVVLKIGSDYPYYPPQVYCHDKGFFHPNKDIMTNQIMFSLIDPKFWKPTFELSQVLCGIEMILLSPEPSYSSIRASEIYKSALEEGIFQKTLGGNMDLEGDNYLESTNTATYMKDLLSKSCHRDPRFEIPYRSQPKIKAFI